MFFSGLRSWSPGIGFYPALLMIRCCVSCPVLLGRRRRPLVPQAVWFQLLVADRGCHTCLGASDSERVGSQVVRCLPCPSVEGAKLWTCEPRMKICEVTTYPTCVGDISSFYLPGFFRGPSIGVPCGKNATGTRNMVIMLKLMVSFNKMHASQA